MPCCLRRRLLKWDDGAQRQLIRLVLCDRLKLDVEEVDARLAELAVLLPDIAGKLERAQASLLASLLIDLPGLADKLLQLRQMLPRTNASSLVSRFPALVLEYEPSQVQQRLGQLQQQLPGVNLEMLLEKEPMVLRADIPLVLEDIKRLMPSSRPLDVLVANPQMVLDMRQLDMPSSIEVDGVNLQ